MEGLSRVVPRRRYTKGPRPKVTGQEAKGAKDLEDDPDSQWVFPPNDPTDWEKKKILAACVEIGIHASFSNHIYCFGGRAFKQLKGGPIGSRLTMAVARIVMMVFGDRLRQAMATAG